MKTSVDNFILSFDQFDQSSRLEALEKIVKQLNPNELNTLLNCVDYERLNKVTRLEVLKCLSQVFEMDQIAKALCILDTGFHKTECKNCLYKDAPVEDRDNLLDSEDELRDPAIIAVAKGLRGVRKQDIKASTSKGRGRGMRRRREYATSDSDSETWDVMTSGTDENKEKMRKNKNIIEGRSRESRVPPISRRLREETRVVKNKTPSLNTARTVHNDGKITITGHAEPRTVLEENGKIKITREMVTNDEKFEDNIQKQPKSRSVFEQYGKLTITRELHEDEKSKDDLTELEKPDSNLSAQASEFTNSKPSPILRTNKENIAHLHEQMATHRATEEDTIMNQNMQWAQMRPQLLHPQLFQPPGTLHSAQQIPSNPFLGMPSDPRISTSQYPATTEPQYQGHVDANQYQPVTEQEKQLQFPPPTGYYNPFLCELLNAHKQLAS